MIYAGNGADLLSGTVCLRKAPADIDRVTACTSQSCFRREPVDICCLGRLQASRLFRRNRIQPAIGRRSVLCIGFRIEKPFMVLLKADAMLGTHLHTSLTAATPVFSMIWIMSTTGKFMGNFHTLSVDKLAFAMC